MSSISGCPHLRGWQQTSWYFASNGATADQVRQVCAASGGTFLTP